MGCLRRCSLLYRCMCAVCICLLLELPLLFRLSSIYSKINFLYLLLFFGLFFWKYSEKQFKKYYKFLIFGDTLLIQNRRTMICRMMKDPQSKSKPSKYSYNNQCPDHLLNLRLNISPIKIIKEVQIQTLIIRRRKLLKLD